MNKSTHLFTLLAAALLTACGGGGEGSIGSSTPPPVVVVPPPVVAAIINPLTGAAAPGSPTTSVSGMAWAGAIVTAYSVNPDGSSGAALGAASAVDRIGEYHLTLTVAPTSWVRLVARGGKFDRQLDGSSHLVESMELVTPFFTTAYNNLQISPITDIASHIMGYKAKTGSTLLDAFKFGMSRTLQLDVVNLTLMDDTSVYLNVLKGSIVSAKGYSPAQSTTMGELLAGIERFGIMYDLPQNLVWRVLASAGENSYPLAAVDGAGAAINVGAWVNGSFDTTAVVSLQTLMNAKTLNEIKVVDNSGARVAPRVSDMVSLYLIEDAFIYQACDTGVSSTFKERYPFFSLDSAGKIPAATCATVQRRMLDFFLRQAANNSRNLK